MERGYLVAVLAIIATFTGLSRGFHAAEQWSVIHIQRFGAMAKSECHANAATRAIAKVQSRLRPHYAQESQLLAEMNVPVPPVPPDMTEDLATPSVAASSCARARIMQEAQHAQRQMLRMQREMERTSRQMRIEPMAIHVQFPPDFQQRIQAQTEAAVRLAREQVKVQLRTHCPRENAPSDSEQ